MPGTRHLTVVLFAALWIVSACGSAAPLAQTNPPVAPATGSGPEQTAARPSDPPAPVTAAPTVAPPTVEPTRAPEPTATTPPVTPEPTEAEDQPNLIVLEFEADEDPVLVGVPATVTALVWNIGLADAGPFAVEIVLTTPGQPDLVLESQAVEDGLAAGDSMELTTSIKPTEAAELRLVARADVVNDVTEEVESDNERVLEIEAKILGNINVPADGFTVVAHPDSPGAYLFYFTYVNTGSSTLVATITAKFFAYTSTDVYVEWGSHNLDLDLDPNESQQIVVAYPVEPGTYRAYFLADSDNTLEESDEGDNEAYYDFTAP